MLSWCPVKECTLPARIAVYNAAKPPVANAAQDWSAALHRPRLVGRCRHKRKRMPIFVPPHCRRSPIFGSQSCPWGALELLWKFRHNREARSRVLSEQTYKQADRRNYCIIFDVFVSYQSTHLSCISWKLHVAYLSPSGTRAEVMVFGYTWN